MMIQGDPATAVCRPKSFTRIDEERTMLRCEAATHKLSTLNLQVCCSGSKRSLASESGEPFLFVAWLASQPVTHADPEVGR